MLTDGESLYAWRTSSDNKSPTLYCKQTIDESQRNNTIIASEPIDNDTDAWQSVPESHLLKVTGETVTINPLNTAEECLLAS